MHPTSDTHTLRPLLHDPSVPSSSLPTPTSSPLLRDSSSPLPLLAPEPALPLAALTRKRSLFDEPALNKRIRPDMAARRFQAVQMRDEVKDIPVRESDDGLPYVLVEDILDVFSVYGEELQLDGQSVPYLQDHHQQRLAPFL